MGSVFALQVRTGQEIRAKEMLKMTLLNESDTHVKGIYAFETYTEMFSQGDDINHSPVNEEDISSHLAKERYRSAISNKRSQLEALNKHTTPELKKVKDKYRKEIRMLESEMRSVRENSKSLHSVLSGYLLVELNQNSTYLPNHLYHLFNNTPLINNVLSTTPILEEELNQFIDGLDIALEPQIVMNMDSDIDHESIDRKASKLINEVNNDNVTSEEEEELLSQIDDLRVSVIEKVKSFLSKKKNNTFGLKAFIQNNKEVVSMPLSTFQKMYKSLTEARKFFGNYGMNKKDFLKRLKLLFNNPRLSASQ